jgi:hypothetical protein
METMAVFFEGFMIVCFGVSWPAAIWKTVRTKTVKGMSPVFLWFVFAGYLSGILFKMSEATVRGGVSPVIVLYILNTLMVGIEMVLYYRYCEKKAAATGVR